MKHLTGFVRSIQTGDPVPNRPVTVKDDVTGIAIPAGGVYMASPNPMTSDADGMFSWSCELSPGPVRVEADIIDGLEVRVRSGQETMQTGEVFLSDLPTVLQGWADGVMHLQGGAGLSVSPVTGQRQVTLSPGVANMRGRVWQTSTPRTITISPNTSLTTRVDLIVLEQYIGGSYAGRQDISVIQGTAAGVQPSTNANPDIFQLPVGKVTISQNASSVTVEDIRLYAYPHNINVPDGSITSTKLSQAILDSITAASTNWAGATVIKGGTTVTGVKTITLSDGLELNNNGSGAVTIVATAPPAPAGGATQREFNDQNFTDNQVISGNRKLAQVAITLSTPGTYILETWGTLSIRGNWSEGGHGYANIRLAGSGTPQGADASSRNFENVHGVARQVVISGRRKVTITGSTTYTAELWCSHTSGGTATALDGVLFITAK